MPPKKRSSTSRADHDRHLEGISRIVTSSDDANTGPILASSIASCVRYRRTMRALIASASLPDRTSVVPDADTQQSNPGCRTSTVIEAAGIRRRFSTFLLAEYD